MRDKGVSFFFSIDSSSWVPVSTSIYICGMKTIYAVILTLILPLLAKAGRLAKRPG